MPIVTGTVVRLDGPIQVPARRDPWRAMTLTLLTIMLLPFLLILWCVGIAVKLALSFFGIRPSFGGHGLLDEIILFHGLSLIFRQPEPDAIYHYIVTTPEGQVAVRQEGELTDGRVFPGNQVRLRGRLRRGVLVLHEGINQTLGTHLTPRRSRWRYAFLIVLLLMVALIALTLASAASNGGLS